MIKDESKIHKISIAAGGIVQKDGQVLLVQITYGPNKGMWMLPGGYLDPGESLAEAAIREVKEETGLDTQTLRVVGIRDGVRLKEGGLESNLYVVFEMGLVGGTLAADEDEVSAAAFHSIDEILASDKVVELSKKMIQNGLNPESGLNSSQDQIWANDKYRAYTVYI